jgi:putative oxidoreductase
MQSCNESQTATPTLRGDPPHKGAGKVLLDGEFKMQSAVPWGGLAGRLLLAQLFIIEAMLKLGDYPATEAYMIHYGVPTLLLLPAIAVELGGGLLVALGWQTRLAALALAGFCLATAPIFHGNLADRSQLIHFQKDLALAGAFLILWMRGAGQLSLDAWLLGRRLRHQSFDAASQV